MNGLLAQQPNPQQAPQQQTMQPGQQNQQGMQPQEVYNKLVTMVLEYLYSDDGVMMVKQGAQMPGQPHQNIGLMVARMMQRLFITAKTQGKDIPAQILFSAGMEISQAIADMVLEMGAFTKEQAPQIAEEAFYQSIVKLSKETSTEIFTKAERQEFLQLLQVMKQAKGGMPQ